MLFLDRAHFDHMTGADRALQVEVLGLFRMQVEGWSGRHGERWRLARGGAHAEGLGARHWPQCLAAACEAAETAEDSEAGLAGVRAALNDALGALEQFAAEAA
jgi:hypothetical protein